jgi:hypothetical protein
MQPAFPHKSRKTPGAGSGDGAQVLPEGVKIYGGGLVFKVFVGALPHRERARQQVAAFVGEDEDSTATVAWILLDFDQAAAFERLERCRQSGPIHGEQGSDRPHGRRFGTIERHEQRKLAVGKFEGAQFLIEAPGEGSRGTLHVKTKAPVFDHECCLVGQRFCT